MHKFDFPFRTPVSFVSVSPGGRNSDRRSFGDRFGRKYIDIHFRAAPYVALPYANLFWTGILSVIIGVVIASAFSAILVFAQELMPGKVGMISGLFFGFAFGMGGLGSTF
jgi:FSR family fosmidomycin resistance protein-like MFS transporter